MRWEKTTWETNLSEETVGQAYKGQNANIYRASGRKDTNERRKEEWDSLLHSF